MDAIGAALALVLWATIWAAILLSPYIAWYLLRSLYRLIVGPPRQKWTHERREQDEESLADFRLTRSQRTLARVGLASGVALFGLMLLVWSDGSRDICTIHDINPLMVTHKCWDDNYAPAVGFGAVTLILISGSALVVSWSNRRGEPPHG